MLECALFLQMKVTKGLSMVHQIVEGKLRVQAMKHAVPLNISPGLIIHQRQVSNVLLQQLPCTDSHNRQVSPTLLLKDRVDAHYFAG